jgi:hypothetical protein
MGTKEDPIQFKGISTLQRHITLGYYQSVENVTPRKGETQFKTDTYNKIDVQQIRTIL